MNFYFVFATGNLPGFKNLEGLALDKTKSGSFSCPAPRRGYFNTFQRSTQTTTLVPKRTILLSHTTFLLSGTTALVFYTTLVLPQTTNHLFTTTFHLAETTRFVSQTTRHLPATKKAVKAPKRLHGFCPPDCNRISSFVFHRYWA